MKETAKYFADWARNARKELYGKPSPGPIEKSKRRALSKAKATHDIAFKAFHHKGQLTSKDLGLIRDK